MARAAVIVLVGVWWAFRQDILYAGSRQTRATKLQ